MNTSKNILNRMRSFFRYGTRLNPFRDWLVLVLLSILLLIASVVWNSFTFLRLTRGEVFETTPVNGGAVSQDTIGTIQNVFKTRANEARKYRTEYYFIDPSH